jgi:hypothetical protein
MGWGLYTLTHTLLKIASKKKKKKKIGKKEAKKKYFREYPMNRSISLYVNELPLTLFHYNIYIYAYVT